MTPEYMVALGWQRCSPWFSKRTIDGGRTVGWGTIFRRPAKNPTFFKRWDYFQLPETEEQWSDRVW